MLISSGNARPGSPEFERAADVSLQPTSASIPEEAENLGRSARLSRGLLALLVAGLFLAVPRHLGAAGAIPAALRTKPVHAMASIYGAVSECRSTLSEEKRWQIADAVESNARRYGFDPLFVQALVEVESTCSPTAKSPRGALGLIQVRPSTARAVAREEGLEWSGSQKLLEPDFNVNVGLAYLNQLGEHFDDPHAAIAAYNLGPTRVSQMPQERVKKSRYVRNLLARYEHLLDERAI